MESERTLIASVDLSFELRDGESEDEVVFRLWELLNSLNGKGLHKFEIQSTNVM